MPPIMPAIIWPMPIPAPIPMPMPAPLLPSASRMASMAYMRSYIPASIKPILRSFSAEVSSGLKPPMVMFLSSMPMASN